MLEDMILRAARLMAAAYIDSGLSYQYFDSALDECKKMMKSSVKFDTESLSFSIIKRVQEQRLQEMQQQ